VVELSVTVAVSENVPPASALPLPIVADVQVALLYRRTVDSASAEPDTSGLLLLAGPIGVTASPVGRVGAVLSWMYVVNVVEQAELFPAGSCDRARNEVVELVLTLTGTLYVPPTGTVAVPATAPEQSDVV